MTKANNLGNTCIVSDVQILIPPKLQSPYSLTFLYLEEEFSYNFSLKILRARLFGIH